MRSPANTRPAALTGATRAEHEAIHRHCDACGVVLSPDGRQLLRTHYRHGVRPVPGTGRFGRPGQSRNVSISGLVAPAYLIAHILRAGPTGPLIAPGPWTPMNGDWQDLHAENWLNVHPDEWRLTSRQHATPPTRPDEELF